MALPRNVVREDHRLEEQAEKTSTALAELRWRWTLDETNDKRVGFSEYARAVGRSEGSVRHSVGAFVQYRTNPGITMAEARTRANLSEDRLAATKAVAEARGVTLETAEHKRRNETRRVQQIAAEKAEKKGTSIEAEAPAVAQWIVKAEQAVENVQKERAQKTDLRLIEVEGKLLRMIRLGVETLTLLRATEWDDEAVEFMEESVANLKAVVNFIDIALAGAADIDWDKELAKLTEVA